MAFVEDAKSFLATKVIRFLWAAGIEYKFSFNKKSDIRLYKVTSSSVGTNSSISGILFVY